MARFRRRWLLVLQLASLAATGEAGRRTHAAARFVAAMGQGAHAVAAVSRRAWHAVAR